MTWGPGGVIVQDFGWVVLEHPEMGNLGPGLRVDIE